MVRSVNVATANPSVERANLCVTPSAASTCFTRRNLGQALIWGAAGGLAFGLYTYIVFGAGQSAPPLLLAQVAVGVPVWLLIMSPFQEFLFRGWLQPRLQAALGRWMGIVIASLAFALWHYFPPLEGTMTSTLPISTPIGVVSAAGLGLLMGYLYDRTQNMVAPWLGHALAGLALVLIGTMTFLQYNP